VLKVFLEARSCYLKGRFAGNKLFEKDRFEEIKVLDKDFYAKKEACINFN
jgi:hypothetical protein